MARCRRESTGPRSEIWSYCTESHCLAYRTAVSSAPIWLHVYSEVSYTVFIAMHVINDRERNTYTKATARYRRITRDIPASMSLTARLFRSAHELRVECRGALPVV